MFGRIGKSRAAFRTLASCGRGLPQNGRRYFVGTAVASSGIRSAPVPSCEQRRCCAAAAGAGPDAPVAASAPSSEGQPRWPGSAWHDHLQYHFFFEGLFVQARVFLTPSLEETSLWIFDHNKGEVEELYNSGERFKQAEGDHLDIANSRVRIQDGPGGGSITLASASGSDEAELYLEFANKNVFSWLPAGQQDDIVIHRPNLELKLKYKGKEMKGRGYSKRYYGQYGPHWGYRFIQSSMLKRASGPYREDGRHFLWTADATFRLGDGEAKYNYFKLLDSQTGELVQAASEDTYQQDEVGYAEISGEKYRAIITPLGEWVHDYKAGGTNSRMQLRYCKIKVERGSKPPLEGYALNERCFGVLG